MRQLLSVVVLILTQIALASVLGDAGMSLAFLQFAIPAAIGIGSHLLKNRGDDKPSRTQNRFLSAMNPQQRRADVAEDFYLEQATSFDPREALGEYGEAAYGDFRRNLGRDVERLGGAAVGAGRLDTGFYDVDQGELVSDLASRYQQAISGQAMNAANLQQRNIEGVGRYGQGARNTYLDMLAGQMDRETAERNAKRDMWGNLIGSGLGAAATYFGSKGG